MSALNNAIHTAFAEKGENKTANDKVYLEFIKDNFIIPIEKDDAPDAEPRVLFLIEQDQTFLPVFTDHALLDAWATDIADNINVLRVSGVDLLKNIGDNVIVCLNIGDKHYKEFHPQEIARMKGFVLKLFKK